MDKVKIPEGKIKVISGANEHELGDMHGYSVGDVRRYMREILNIGDDHSIVLVNGNRVHDENIALQGNETVEFKRPAGQKG